MGGEVYDGVYSGLLSTRGPGESLHVKILDRWQKPGDVTDVPIVQYGNVVQPTERGLIDASYLTIKNVSFGYNLPKNLVTKAGLSNVRFFMTAENLGIFTKLKGMDPQYDFSGGQNFSYVPVRTISLGLDVKF